MIEIVLLSLSVVFSGLSYWNYKRAAKAASLAESFTTKLTVKPVSATTEVAYIPATPISTKTAPRYRQCGKCGRTVARYTVGVEGAVVCTNCK